MTRLSPIVKRRATSMPMTKNGLAHLRAWWFRRQGLTLRTSAKTVAGCLRRSGWLATVGSTGVYLSMRARLPGISRESIDRAAMDGVDVIEVPGAHARPAILVPRDEVALALRLHWASYAKHAAPQFASGRYSETAVKAIASQACRVLDEGPLSTADIRAVVTHPGAGELLTGALIDLAVRGIVRRYPADGRLDSSKYLYELRHPDDRPDLDAEGDAATVTLKATRLFLRRHGPATVDEIVEWAGLTKGSIREALVSLGAERLTLGGWTDDAWLLPDEVRAWNTFTADDKRVVLLPYRDPFVSVRRPPSVLARRDTARVLNAKLKPVAIRDLAGFNHHAIVSGGELVGVWEYDPQTERIVTRVWDTDKALRTRVADAATATERFVRQQLADAKLSAVDPQARRATRIAFCSK
jgi:Winged helix DNA-binding domain